MHGIIFSQLVLGIVKNKKDAVIAKQSWVAQYHASLRVQVLLIRFLARTRFRLRKRKELAAAIKFQALARGYLGRGTPISTMVADKLRLARELRARAAWTMARLCFRMIHRMRLRKKAKARIAATLLLQSLARGFLARQRDHKLRDQRRAMLAWLNPEDTLIYGCSIFSWQDRLLLLYYC